VHLHLSETAQQIHPMKLNSILLAIAFVFSAVQIGFAQLPDGSVAPDFTITDIEGEDHNLYSYLDSGYSVIIDFSATWCGPCWNYHTSGVFEELYAAHGPDGSNELRILFIESDNNTTDDDLHGTGTNTWGDWTEGVDYPIADNGGSVFNAYECAFYPTIMTVCPNRLLKQTGQASFDSHAAYVQSIECAPASLPLDVGLVDYIGSVRSCPNTPTELGVTLINNGTEPLTSCTLEATTLFGTELLTYEWTGYLDTYEMENVNLGDAIFPTTSMFSIEVTSEDGYDGNNSVTATMNLSQETATSLLRVQITSDNMPGDNRWSISDLSGEEVAGTAFGDMSESNTDYNWWVNLEALGCFTFNLFDLTGNGGDLSCSFSTYNEGGFQTNNIFSLNNNGNWDQLNKGFSVNEVNMSIGESFGIAPIAIFPNPLNQENEVQISGLTGQETRIELHSSTGALIRTWIQPSQSGTLNLPIGKLESGLYIISVHDSNGIQSQRLIKS
jgi:hypothetical protein